MTATAEVNGETLTSNRAVIDWAAGPHVTSMNLNLAPGGGSVDLPVTLSATLLDVPPKPLAGLAGQRVQFSLGDQNCTCGHQRQGPGQLRCQSFPARPVYPECELCRQRRVPTGGGQCGVFCARRTADLF